MTREVLVVDDSLTVRMDLMEVFEGAGSADDAVRDRRGGAGAASPSAVRAPHPGHSAARRGRIDLLEGRFERKRPTRRWSSCRPRRRSATAFAASRPGPNEYIGKPYDLGYIVARAREMAREGSPR